MSLLLALSIAKACASLWAPTVALVLEVDALVRERRGRAAARGASR